MNEINNNQTKLLIFLKNNPNSKLSPDILEQNGIAYKPNEIIMLSQMKYVKSQLGGGKFIMEILPSGEAYVDRLKDEQEKFLLSRAEQINNARQSKFSNLIGLGSLIVSIIALIFSLITYFR